MGCSCLIQGFAQGFQRCTAPGQPGPVIPGQHRVALVQRLQNEVRRAGGAKEVEGIADGCLVLHGGIRAQMQVGPSCQDRQSLVAGIAAHGRPQCNGVAAAAGQKVQVRPVGVIHQQGHTLRLADGCQPGDILHTAQIIRAGDVDAKGPCPLLCLRLQGPAQGFRRHRAAAQRPGCFRGRPEPLDVEIQQGGGIEQGLVGVAGRQQHRTLPRFGSPLQRQRQHGPDALGRALRAVISARRAKEGRGVGLAPGNDALGLVQLIGPLDLGDVPCLTAQKRLAFMAGHVQAAGAGLRILPHKIHDGGGHGAHSQASPVAQALHWPPISMGTSMPWAASSWFSATLIMMAHSIRLRNSSQPYSYTPLMLPVAW